MRLQVRVTIWLLVLFGTAGSVAFLGMTRFERQSLERQSREAGTVLALAVESGLEVSMLKNSPEDVSQAVSDVGRGPLIQSVAVYGTDAEVWVSSTPTSDLGIKERTALESAMRRAKPATAPNEGALTVFVPVPNQARCARCHETGAKVLGVVGVSMDERPLQGEISRSTRNLLYVAAVPLIAGILISLWAVGRSVLRPLAMVGGGAERLAGGDFAVRLPEFRGRELAAVSRAFNGMAMRLQRQASDLIGTVEQLRSDLEGLEEIQSLVTSGAGLGEVLSRAAHHLGSALGASGVGIWRKGEPEPRAVSGDRVPPAEAVRLAEGGAVHSSAGPLGAVDVNTAVNWLVAPATRRGTVLAVLGVVWDPPGPLAQAERDLVVSAAGVVGIAVENSDLLERLQEKEETLEGLLRTTLAAQEEERRRVAREIHDDSSQVLSALIMNIDLLQNQPACPEPFRVKLEAAKALAEEAARNLDKIMVDLRPALLDELGLAAALRWYVAQVREVWDVPVELLVEQARRLPEHVEVTAFRIAQEALGNAVRHSRARHVRVSIEAGERTAKVEVEDDGVGFDVPEAMSRARTGQTAGLVGMRERAELLGGSLRIESRPGEGTKVAAEIPFSAG